MVVTTIRLDRMALQLYNKLVIIAVTYYPAGRADIKLIFMFTY